MDEKAELDFDRLRLAVIDMLDSKRVGSKTELLYFQLLTFHLSVEQCGEIQQTMIRHIDNLHQSGCNIIKLEFFSNFIKDCLIELTDLLRVEMLKLYEVVQEAPPI